MASTPGPVFTCRLRPELYPAYRRTYLRKQVTVCLMWLLPLPIILWFFTNDSAPHVTSDPIYLVARLLTIAIFVSPVAALMAFVIYRAMKKARREYEACTFVFAPDTIVRTDADGRQIAFDLRQVTKTQRVSKKGLMLLTGMPANFLFIPEQLDNYEEVARFLEDGRPQAPVHARMPLIYRSSVTNAVIVVCWLTALLSPLHWLALLGGVLSVSWCAFAIWHTQRNPNCTASAKRGVWFLLVLVAIMIWHFSPWPR